MTTPPPDERDIDNMSDAELDTTLGITPTPDPIRSVLSRVVVAPRVLPHQTLSAVTFVHLSPRESTTRRELMAYPQLLFRGEGLWLWGSDETTLIHNIKVGNQNCFSISHVAFPGFFFEAGLSFEEFEKLLEPVPGGWTHERLKAVPPAKPHQRIRMLTAEIGNNLVLDVEGPITHAVMWGLSVQ